ncbi:zinc finger C3HC4 type domain containing protein [Nitzschia inconspicua]|uniref:Zinc finger C3HC4 type domain containing protein n=1 Tax=Nitzschia inconspicua TaxID=303405 RepID=A0A9K3PYT9_9STRA|nr:zinc finger C3HC4 type domain containing protein [Nitzschia inconspicua]
MDDTTAAIDNTNREGDIKSGALEEVESSDSTILQPSVLESTGEDELLSPFTVGNPPTDTYNTDAATPTASMFATDENTCPICLNPSNDLVSGPCSHSLCVPCMEKVLNAEASEQRWPPQSAADIHLSAPTLGRCPICRTQISLFQVRHSITSLPQYPPDFDYWKKDDDDDNDTKADGSQQDGKEEPTTNGEDSASGGDSSDIFAGSGPLSTLKASITSALTSITTNNSSEKSKRSNPLKNSVYIPYRGRAGQFSFHWDWENLQRNAKDDQLQHGKIKRPFINITEAIKKNPDKWRLEDGSIAPKIKFMEPDCHFHEASRTFHGTVLWPKRLNGSYEWDIILGFSKDYRFLSSGRIHMKRERTVLEKDIPATYSSEKRTLCQFPLDGHWTVSWANSQGVEKRSEIRVINSEFRQSGWSFFLNFDDPRHPFALWPRSKHRQWVEEGVDLSKEPMGPKPGEKIRWKTSDPRFPELVWTRQTVGPVPTPKVTLFGMGQDKHFYQRLHAKTDGSIPKYNGKSVFGNVFTKRLYIGSSSYHFLSPTNCFISYRHPACRDLPPLDDGSPLPTRVDFHNVEFHDEQRRLTATIEWEEDFGTSWNDNVRWKLDMYFDSEYMVILKGGIQCEWCQERRARPRPPRPPPRHRPPPVPVYVPPTPEEQEERPVVEPNRNEEWIMSGYGHDQVYVNAAALERYRSPSFDVNSGDSNNQERDGESGPTAEDEPESLTVDYKSIARVQASRLEREGATKRSIDFLMYLFQIADENDNTNPIDYLVHS